MSLPRPGRYGRGTSAPGKVDQHMLLKCRVRLSVLSTAVAVLIVGAVRHPRSTPGTPSIWPAPKSDTSIRLSSR